MTDLLYLKDSYQKNCTSKVISCEKNGNQTEIILDKTVFYPQGGGQPSDTGIIKGSNGKLHVKHVIMHNENALHIGTLEGHIDIGETVDCDINWDNRYHNMRVHTAGHIVHEAVISLLPNLVPLKADHGNKSYIEYKGSVTVDKQYAIEAETNKIVEADLPITTELVSLEELKKRAAYVPAKLPKNKPLRILTIGKFNAIPDGGTQLKSTKETGYIFITKIENSVDSVRVFYEIREEKTKNDQISVSGNLSTNELIGSILEMQNDALNIISGSDDTEENLRLKLLGKNSDFSKYTKLMRQVPKSDISRVGIVINEVKKTIENEFARKRQKLGAQASTDQEFTDVSLPGIKPPMGHLHIVTQAITEITGIFERIGFSRVRYPEVDWDWYAFEALNMPPDHPARDEWETFHIKVQSLKLKVKSSNQKFKKMVLTPHTSNGQVREMEKGRLPIRMINIAKCYRRQSDVSHAPMFHQFEGLYVDKDVSIAHLKGVCDYFFRQYFGSERKSRLRPYHFQFTEPSFEVDVSCGLCNGTGKLSTGLACRVCKEGWLELGGAGMVHPQVLKNGGIDPKKYSGFAFGWGVERVSMMKAGVNIDDLRIMYENDIRFLEQF